MRKGELIVANEICNQYKVESCFLKNDSQITNSISLDSDKTVTVKVNNQIKKDINYTIFAQAVDKYSKKVEPYLGSLTGELIGGIATALLLAIIFKLLLNNGWNFFKKIVVWFKRDTIYILMPKDIDTKREHLFHQINGFSTFLNKETNKKIKPKYIMIDGRNIDEIKNFLEKIKSKWYSRNIIIIAMMSDIFNETLKQLDENYSKKDKNIKVIGTLCSESEAFSKENLKIKAIRVFPPDYDEAEIAYKFFYHKVLNYFCTDHTCDYSHENKKIQCIVYHSESYGQAIFDEFDRCFSTSKRNVNYRIHSFADQDISKNIYIQGYDYNDDEGVTVDFHTDAIFHFIFLVGYEPQLSNMLRKTFDKLDSLDIKKDKVCLLLPPTVAVENWKEKICEFSDKLQELKGVYYLKSLIPPNNFEEFKESPINNVEEHVDSSGVIYKIKKQLMGYKKRGDEKIKQLETKIDAINFLKVKNIQWQDYRLDKINITDELKTKLGDNYEIVPNYINTFVYVSLQIANNIRNNKKQLTLNEIKLDAIRRMSTINEDKMKMYDNGDTINHFQIREFVCTSYEKNLEENENNEK